MMEIILNDYQADSHLILIYIFLNIIHIGKWIFYI